MTTQEAHQHIDRQFTRMCDWCKKPTKRFCVTLDLSIHMACEEMREIFLDAKGDTI